VSLKDPGVREALADDPGRGGILAAVELGLSNSKLEGLNSKVRLISDRGYEHHSAVAVIAIIHLLGWDHPQTTHGR
jgi:hypothetical protein